MVRYQSISAKIGEVNFRQKLVKQHLGEREFFSGEPDKKEILSILKQRVQETREILKKLKLRGFTLSPFLEIGAEKGQRSTLLVNEFAAWGFASDISSLSLASAPRFAKLLGFGKIPKLLCCDSYHLPFKDNSFPFVFCFETLHHFPDPTPVIREIHRVLMPGGVFYLGEEPIRQVFNLRLWRRGYHLTLAEKFLKIIGLLPFVSHIGKTETTHGVLEEEFSLGTWKRALSIFAEVEITIRPVFFGPSLALSKEWYNEGFLSAITIFLIALEGGGIEGFGVKKGKFIKESINKNCLICPDCKNTLITNHKRLVCSKCNRTFKKEAMVPIILPINLEKRLYG